MRNDIGRYGRTDDVEVVRDTKMVLFPSSKKGYRSKYPYTRPVDVCWVRPFPNHELRTVK